MPTYDVLPSFWHGWRKLTAEQRLQFNEAVEHLYDDLLSGKGFRPGLRIKGVQGHPHVWEMTWADDGRATFTFGDEVVAGHRHII